MTDTVKNDVRPPKPARPESRPENLPRALKMSAKFCVWNYAWDEKKQRYIKMPYSLRTGKGCRCNTEEDFCTFDEAVLALHRYDGLGVGIFRGLVGIDIDHCVDDQRTLSAMAQDIVQTIGSYTEISPSGHGVRILLTVSEDFAKNHFADREAYKARYRTKRDDVGLEIYVAGMTSRYLTVTGNATMQSRYLEQRDTELLKVLDKYMRQPEKPAEAQPVREETASPGASTSKPCDPLPLPEPEPSPVPSPEPAPKPAPVPAPAPAPVSLSDKELIDKICHSAQGQKFRDLWSGNWQKYYSSQSSADMALCGTLAFWTGKDAARMESLFSRSALGQRGKWKDRQDYRSWTIQHAIDGCADVYSTDDTPLEWDAEINDAPEPQYQPQPQTVSESQSQKPPENTQAVQSSTPEESEPEVQIAEPVPGQGKPSLIHPQDTVSCYIDGSMGTDIAKFKDSSVKTGFSQLDICCTSLYAGLYVVAAISSLGKTTFCNQLADQVASQGRDVLYFSLEQSRLDMVSKSIARAESQIDSSGHDFISSHGIKLGQTSQLLQKAISKYREDTAPHMHVIEGNFGVSYKDISQYITEYIDANVDPENHLMPVILIDYLQVVTSPRDVKNQSTKETVDETVTALKRLSRKYNLTIIAICSVNRANYLTPIDFESLKESGNIEYTCDVLWGLQLSCLTRNPVFANSTEDKSKIQKREIVKQEKAKEPREIELVCLKNRFGISSFECYYKYHCRQDLFEEDGYRLPNSDEDEGEAEEI